MTLLGDYNAQHLYHEIKPPYRGHHRSPKLLDQVLELPRSLRLRRRPARAAARPKRLSKEENDYFYGIPEIKRNLPEIIAWLLGLKEVWGAIQCLPS